jgi:hypothetical protein
MENDNSDNFKKTEKNELTSSYPLSFDIPDHEKVFDFTITTPYANNINPYYNTKGKNLFESPFKNSLGMYFHSSPIDVRINSFINNTEDKEISESAYFYSFIKKPNSLVKCIDLNMKEFNQANWDVKVIKNENLVKKFNELKEENKENYFGSSIFNINGLNSRDMNILYKTDKNETDNINGNTFAYNQNPFKKLNFTPPEKSESSGGITCKCKKSKCLKLYCDCFANGEYCKDCNCTSCKNTETFESERQTILATIKAKLENSKGCSCTKSHCKKRYCECFNKGIECSDECRCLACNNCQKKKIPKNSITIKKKVIIDSLPLSIESNNSICYDPVQRKTFTLLGNKRKTSISTPMKVENPYAKRYKDTSLSSLVNSTAANTNRKRNVIKDLDKVEKKEISRKLNMQEYEVNK